jgi:two-component system alkaline phosphatase synthesis response regulator PhoP
MRDTRSKARVLVVDDNLQTQKMLRFLLDSEGYQVSIATQAEDARTKLADAEVPIHLMLLDVMMPSLDGFTLCSHLRKEGDTVPIVFLSARADASDRAEGLRRGADDYVVKPFDPGELLARIAAVLRRSKLADAAIELRPSMRVGDVELDSARLKVKVAGRRETDLTPTETKLLHCLMRNAGRVLSRDALINQVWDYDHDGYENTVDVYIGRLRKKVEHDPEAPTYIRTIRGVGYMLHQPTRLAFAQGDARATT